MNTKRKDKQVLAQELIDSSPGFKLLVSMSENLEALINDARSTTDKALIKAKYELCLVNCEDYMAEYTKVILKHATDTCEEWKKICGKQQEDMKFLIKDRDRLQDQIKKLKSKRK